MNVRSSIRLCYVLNITNIHLPFSAYKPFLSQIIKDVGSIQLRIKSTNKIKNLDLAYELSGFMQSYKKNLIINDDVDIAKKVNADLHLGQSDVSPTEARKVLGPEKIIGLSIETIEQLHKANLLNCINYVAASAVFRSRTKPDCKTWWGLKGLQEVAKLSKHPVVAIGGINLKNINMIMQAGASGAAVVGAIDEANNPRDAAASLMQQINNNLSKPQEVQFDKNLRYLS